MPRRSRLIRRRSRGWSALRGGLKVTQSGNSHVLAISYTASSPDGAAQFANGVADAYVQGQLGDKLATTRGAKNWLTGRVEEMRQVLLDQRGRSSTGGACSTARRLRPARPGDPGAERAELIDAQAEQTARELPRKIRDLCSAAMLPRSWPICRPRR